jgi:hypothetical protein
VSVLNALPPDFLSHDWTKDAVLVHLDLEPLLQKASEAGRHVIVTHGSTVAKLDE